MAVRTRRGSYHCGSPETKETTVQPLLLEPVTFWAAWRYAILTQEPISGGTRSSSQFLWGGYEVRKSIAGAPGKISWSLSRTPEEDVAKAKRAKTPILMGKLADIAWPGKPFLSTSSASSCSHRPALHPLVCHVSASPTAMR